MERSKTSVAGAIAALLLIFSGSCGGGSAQLASQTSDQPTIEQLTNFLFAEMERLGVDPEKGSSQVPAGNEVFDMSATLLDPDGEGPEEPSGIQLAWTERLIGDYDQNGEVNLSDLTQLVVHFAAGVNYDPADERGGIGYWPTGDPDNGGALNWRLARIDGDSNGEINLADVTQIALHWGQRIDGYRLYSRSPGEDEFSVVPNPDDPEIGFTVSREQVDRSHPNKPVRYSYLIDFETGGEYEFKLSKFDSIDGEGSLSESHSYHNQPPVAELTAYPVSGDAPLTVQFDASGSYDPDGYNLWFKWDFDGDGVYDLDSGTDPTVEHTYTEAGEYDAVVLVRDYPGDTDRASVRITVGASSQGPVADIVADYLSIYAPTYVRFDASASYDSDGEIVRYEWDFDGDGVIDRDTGAFPKAATIYLSGGVRYARVTVTDNDGNTDSASVGLSIAVGNDRLYIFPDPLDNDWHDAVGHGDFYDPYIVSSVYYNTDLLTEFSMVAYWYESDTSTSIPAGDLTWVGYPPYNTEWVAPGTFKATDQTIGNVYAYGLSDPIRMSQQVFIRNTAAYPY